MTLATLLASDPRPVFEVLQDAIHTLDSVHRQSKVDALKQAEDSEHGAISPETVTELVNSSRGAAAVSLAATRTAAWQAIAQSHERSVNIDAKIIAQVLEASLAGIFAWVDDAAGGDRNFSYGLKRNVAVGLREALEAVGPALSAQARRSGDRFASALGLPQAKPPDNLGEYVIIRRAELEALRERARRHTPAISDKPAQVYVPDDIEPAPEPSPRSTSDRRPPSVGLISTTATRHYRGR